MNALNAENVLNGCGSGIFVDAITTGTIPANSKIFIMDPNICTSAYDFSGLCASGPIYLLFTTDVSWGSGGNFLNSGGVRYFSLSITDVNGETTYSEYSYDSNLLTNTDGDYAQFSFCEGPATTYGNDGCNMKVLVLPSELIHFNATPQDNIVNLDWATSTEVNVNQHVIQRSNDGEQFSDIISVTAISNSSLNTYYTDIDYQPLKGVSYYRLKTVDFDESFVYSDIRQVSFDNQDPIVFYGNNEWIISFNNDDSYYYTLYSVLGEQITSPITVNSKEDRTSINYSQLPNGVYFINIVSGNYKKSIKVIK